MRAVGIFICWNSKPRRSRSNVQEHAVRSAFMLWCPMTPRATCRTWSPQTVSGFFVRVANGSLARRRDNRSAAASRHVIRSGLEPLRIRPLRFSKSSDHGLKDHSAHNLGWKEANTNIRVLAELGHSKMQNRPPLSATLNVASRTDESEIRV
jgi:hypothetical protein